MLNVQSSQKTFFFFQKNTKQLNPKPNTRELFVCFPGIKVIVTAISDKPEKRTETMPGSSSRRNPKIPPLSPPTYGLYILQIYILSLVFLLFFLFIICLLSRNEGSSASPLTRKLAGHHIRVVGGDPTQTTSPPPSPPPPNQPKRRRRRMYL
jgi:hypothetical protein